MSNPCRSIVITLVVSMAFLSVSGAQSAAQTEYDTDISSASASMDPPFRQNIVVSGPPDTGVSGEWSAMADSKGNFDFGWNSGNGCGFASSHDGGATWSARSYNGRGSDPIVTVDNAGNFYRLCIYGSGGGLDIEIAKSTDGASTWSAWGRRMTGQYHDYPIMAADSGSLIVAYTGTGGAQTRLRLSADDGTTWDSPMSISDTQYPGCIVVDKKSVVYMMTYEDNSLTLLRKSSDAGKTWTQGVDVGTIVGNSRTHCAVDDAGVHLYAISTGPSNVWVSHSGDGGSTWDSTVPVSTGGNYGALSFNSVAIDRAGRAHATWHDKRSGYWNVFYANSTDHGKTWTSEVKVSDHGDPNCSGCSMVDYGQGIVTTPAGDVCVLFVVPREGSDRAMSSCAPLAGGGAPSNLTRITVAPATASIPADQTQKFVASGFDPNGNPVAITPTWTATGGAVDQSGLFTPSKVGLFTVTASQGSVSGSATVDVSHGALTALNVTPAAVTLSLGQTQQFGAAGQDSKGNTVPVTPVWSATGGSISGIGVFSSTTLGTFKVTATQGSRNASATATVLAATIARVEIDPPQATVVVGTVRSFTSRAYDTGGDIVPGVSIAWSVTTPTLGTITATGADSAEFEAGHAPGALQVLASAGPVSAKSGVTIVPGPAARVRVDPPDVVVDNGVRTTFRASATDAYGNPLPAASAFAWTVTGGVGSLDSQSGETVMLTSEGAGGAKGTIVAALGSASGVANITVRPTAIGPAAPGSLLSTLMSPLALALMLAVVVAAVAAVLVGRRRKGKRPNAGEHPFSGTP